VWSTLYSHEAIPSALTSVSAAGIHAPNRLASGRILRHRLCRHRDRACANWHTERALPHSSVIQWSALDVPARVPVSRDRMRDQSVSAARRSVGGSNEGSPLASRHPEQVAGCLRQVGDKGCRGYSLRFASPNLLRHATCGMNLAPCRMWDSRSWRLRCRCWLKRFHGLGRSKH
jgi:hypothetical protein